MTAEKMRGAVFADIGELAVKERDVPALERQNEVILDVQACGIEELPTGMEEMRAGRTGKVEIVFD